MPATFPPSPVDAGAAEPPATGAGPATGAPHLGQKATPSATDDPHFAQKAIRHPSLSLPTGNFRNMGSSRRERGPDLRNRPFRPGDHYTLTFRGSLFFCRNGWRVWLEIPRRATEGKFLADQLCSEMR